MKKVCLLCIALLIVSSGVALKPYCGRDQSPDYFKGECICPNGGPILEDVSISACYKACHCKLASANVGVSHELHNLF